MTRPSMSAGGPDEIVAGHDEIRQVTQWLRGLAGTEWMTLESFEGPLPGRQVIDVPAPRDAGTRRRAVYDEQFLRDPAGLAIVRARVAAGEAVRVHPRIDYRVRLADARAGLVILAPSWTGLAMLVRSAPVMTVLRRQFERAWSQATPFEALPPLPAAAYGPGQAS